MMSDVPTIFFPVIWLEQEAKLPTYLAIIIKIILALPSLAYFFSIILLIVGLILLSLFSVNRIKPKCKGNLSDFRKR